MQKFFLFYHRPPYCPICPFSIHFAPFSHSPHISRFGQNFGSLPIPLAIVKFCVSSSTFAKMPNGIGRRKNGNGWKWNWTGVPEGDGPEKKCVDPEGRAKWTDGNILERETKDWASEKCGELVSDQPADKKEHKIIIIKSWTSRLYRGKGIMIIKNGIIIQRLNGRNICLQKILKMR